MPVTTRLQARRRRLAQEASASDSTSTSPSPSPSPSRASRSSAPSPASTRPATQRFPAIKKTQLANIHGRRQLSHALHYLRSAATATTTATATALAEFPRPERIYVPLLEEFGGEEEVWDDGEFEVELPDYVTPCESEYEYEVPNLPGKSPSLSSGTESQQPAKGTGNVEQATTGRKRKRSSDSFMPTSASNPATASAGLFIHSSPSIPPLPSALPPSQPPNPPKPQGPLAQRIARDRTTLARLRATSLLLRNFADALLHPSPSSSPLLTLPSMETKFYDVDVDTERAGSPPYYAEDPDWGKVAEVHPGWRGSLSPKVSPRTRSGYVSGGRGKRRKVDEEEEGIRKMGIERLVRPVLEVQGPQLPSFREVVEGIEREWRRDALVSWHNRGVVCDDRARAQPLNRSLVNVSGYNYLTPPQMARVPRVMGPVLYNPRGGDGVQRQERRYGYPWMNRTVPGGYARYLVELREWEEKGEGRG